MLGRNTERMRFRRKTRSRKMAAVVRGLGLVASLAVAATAAAQAPGQPAGLTATTFDQGVALSWQDPSDASITRYEVRYAPTGEAFGTWQQHAGQRVSLSVTGLANLVQYTFQLRAVNANGAGPPAEITATPSFSLPNFKPSFGDRSIEPICYRVGRPVEQYLPHAFAAETYALSPALPVGLSFDPASRSITGTPTAVQPATLYTYTASDSDGETDSIKFTLKVTVNTVPSFNGATVASQRYRVGFEIADLTLPAATGSDGSLTYRLRPALPDGLRFDAATRTLAGTPTATTAPTEYAYTATDEDGDTATLTFDIAVESDSMPDFGTTRIDAQRFRVGSTIAGLTLPAATGGNGTLVYALMPALPDGLRFDAATHTLAGTPTVAAAPIEYTYTATDEDGDTATLTFDIAVEPDSMPDFGATRIDAQLFRTDSTIADLTLPAATGGDGTLVYTLSPALPNGLIFNAATRVLAGTPTAVTERAQYTYTATDEDGDTATLTFALEVGPDSMPTFGDAVVPAQSYRVNTAILDLILPAATGGDGTLNYAVAPALPNGLHFNSEIRMISGKPAEQMSRTEYTLTATDEDGDDTTLAFTIEIGMAATVAVADATALEGQDLSFLITLSDALPVPISVAYATTDGTARAGEDYTGIVGFLTLAPGSTEVAITVPVAADSKPEQDEQFTLTLSLLANAEFADSRATGTIVDDDTERVRGEAMGYSLSLFGRTFTADAVDAISGRFQEGPPTTTPLTLASNAFAPGNQALAAGTALQFFGNGSGQSHAPTASAFGTRSAPFHDSFAESAFTSGANTGFALPFGAQAANRGQWTLWGRGSTSRVSSQPNGMQVEGDVRTGYLGVDARLPRNTLVGFAVARSSADFEYRQTGITEGDVSLDMTTVLPYVHWTLCNGLDLWALAGSGQGEATLTDDLGRVDTDLDMRLAAFGLRNKLTDGRDLVWSLKADAFVAALEADQVVDALAAADADVQRLRLLLEGRREWQRSEQSLLAATIEFGARLDNGDGNNGLGAEIGGVLDYRNQAAGLGIEARSRYLLTHAESAFDDWGLSLALEFDPGTPGAGASLRLAPAWGTPSSGIASLWRADRMFGTDLPAQKLDSKQRIDMEVGYGFHAKRMGALRLYSVVTGNDAGSPSYRLGGRSASAKGFGWSLEVDRMQRFGGKADYGILLSIGNATGIAAAPMVR